MKGATSFGEILFLIVPFKPRNGGGGINGNLLLYKRNFG